MFTYHPFGKYIIFCSKIFIDLSFAFIGILILAEIESRINKFVKRVLSKIDHQRKKCGVYEQLLELICLFNKRKGEPN